jgi:hypothetical protein
VTYTSTTFETDLTSGLADLIVSEADPGMGLAWSPTADYTTNQVGIFDTVVPSAPDKILVLTVSGLGDDAVYADSDYNLQVRARGATPDVRPVRELVAGTVADILLGRFPVTLANGIVVPTVVRRYGAPMGVDAANRAEWSDNYLLGAYRPAAHRL